MNFVLDKWFIFIVKILKISYFFELLLLLKYVFDLIRMYVREKE